MIRGKVSILYLIALIATTYLIIPCYSEPLTAKDVRTLEIINSNLVFVVEDTSIGLADLNRSWIWRQELPVPMHWYKIEDGKVLMYLRDGRFIILDLLTGKTLFKKVTELFCGAAIAGDMLAFSNGTHLTVYNISSKTVEWDLSKKLLGDVEIEVWTGSSKLIVTRLANGTFLVFDWTGKALWKYPLARTSTFLWLSRTMSLPVSNVLVVNERVVIVWQNITVFSSDGKVVFSEKIGDVMALSVYQDVIALVSSNRKLVVYSVKENRILTTTQIPVFAVKASIYGNLIALQGVDDNIYLYDISSGEPYCVLSFGEKILDMALSEDTIVAALANTSILKLYLSRVHPRIYINSTEKWVKQNSEAIYTVKLLEKTNEIKAQLIGINGEVKIQDDTIVVRIYPIKHIGNHNVVLYIKSAQGSTMLSLKLHITGGETNLYYWILAVVLIALIIILIPTVLIKQEGFS